MSAWTDFDGARPDFSIVYDAATAPEGVSRAEAQIQSRRWEAWRDGVEDYAYLGELRRRIALAREVGADTQRIAQADSLLKTVAENGAANPDDAGTYRAAKAMIFEAILRLPQ